MYIYSTCDYCWVEKIRKVQFLHIYVYLTLHLKNERKINDKFETDKTYNFET